MSDLRESFRGALLGAAVGDGLGAPFEGRAHVPRDLVDRAAASGEPLRHTDDTVMTLAVAESLVERAGDVDPDHLAGALAEAHDAEPWRGYGPGPPRIFAAMAAGLDRRAAARGLHGGRGSFGNGGAMRVAPVGLVAHRDPARVRELAGRSAEVTHAHPLGREGAALQALAVAAAVRSAGAEMRPAEVLEELGGALGHPLLRERVAAVHGLLEEGPIAERLGNGLPAHEAAPAALAVFLRHRDAFPEAVAEAVALGGDTDTIASMAGALAGARLGAAAIPGEWISRLEDPERVVFLADLLLEVRSTGR